MNWEKAPEVENDLKKIINHLGWDYLDAARIFAFRSNGSTSRAYARIWGFPRIWQIAIDSKPFYCVEVLSEKYDRLSKTDKDKVLIHELLHIPKNFSGSLLPHKGRSRRINQQTVNLLYQKLIANGHENNIR